MSLPIAQAAQTFPPYPHSERAEDRVSERKTQMEWGANALTAPQTPSKRLPHVDRSHVDPQIVQAAEGMETMFLDYLMKTMRQTVPKNEMDLENPATEIYRGMLDTEYAQKAAHAGGVGLSDTIIAYMAPESYTLPQGQVSAPTRSKP